MRLGIRFLSNADAEALAKYFVSYGPFVTRWRPVAARAPLTIADAWDSGIYMDGSNDKPPPWHFAWPMLSLHGESYSSRAWLVRGTAQVVNDDSPPFGAPPTSSLRWSRAEDFAALDGPAYLESLCGRKGEWIVWLTSPTFVAEWLEAELRAAVAKGPGPKAPAPTGPKFSAKG